MADPLLQAAKRARGSPRVFEAPFPGIVDASSDLAAEVRVRRGVLHVEVWRSVSAGGALKTRKSRRTLAVSGYVVAVLRRHRQNQAVWCERAGARWEDHDLTFPSRFGIEQDAHNVRRMFRDALKFGAGTDVTRWRPYELRTRSCRSSPSAGLLLRRSCASWATPGTVVTDTVYRHELRPVPA